MNLSAWVMAARPATLPAAVVPVMVGSAVAFAEGSFSWVLALMTLLSAVAIQVATNLANDVFDFEKGADDERRLGPTRVVQAGLLSGRAVKIGMGVAIGVAIAAGAYLAWAAGPAIILIGVLSIASGIAYTAGPWPLAYLGLGDVFVMVFFGFVAVCGTAFVQLGHVPPAAIASSFGVGALATAILVVNNLRDRETDAEANKRTTAVRFGPRFAVVEFVSLVAIAYLAPVAMVVLGWAPPAVLWVLVTGVVGVYLSMQVATRHGAALNRMLASTGRLLLAYGLVLTVGLVV